MGKWLMEHWETIGKVIGGAGGFWVAVKWSWKNIYKPFRAKYLIWDKGMQELLNNGGSSMKDMLSVVAKDVKVIKVIQEADMQLNPDARFQCSPDGSCILVNDSLCRMFGASRDELLGMGWLNFVVADQRDDVIETWREALISNLEMSYDYNILHGNTGEKIWVHYKAYIKRNSAGDIISIFGIVNKKP